MAFFDMLKNKATQAAQVAGVKAANNFGQAAKQAETGYKLRFIASFIKESFLYNTSSELLRNPHFPQREGFLFLAKIRHIYYKDCIIWMPNYISDRSYYVRTKKYL